MKKKTSITLMAATVLASTILLGACGNKKETTQANSSAKTSQLSRSETVSSKKENETQKSSGATVVEKPKVSPNQSSTAEIKSQVNQLLNQRKYKKYLIKKLLFKLLRINKLFNHKLTRKLTIQQLTANFKISRQKVTNVTRVS